MASKEYTADFETTTNPLDCRVWAWCIVDVDNFSNKYFGNNINTFMKQVYDLSPCKMDFHNLRFDSQFIIYWLLQQGYKFIADTKYMRSMSFSTIINEANQIYALDICFDRVWSHKQKKYVYKTLHLYDSFKKLPFKVSKIAKDFKLPIQKLEIDYKAERPIGHELTIEEKDYVSNDTEIMARALAMRKAQGLNKMTIGADALASYKRIITKEKFEQLFPILDYDTDSFLRNAYHGGWTYVNPKYQGKDLGKGYVLDVNSLYPSVMRNKEYPIGKPIYFEGQYEEDEEYPLYIQRFSCTFKIKPNHLPMIQLKGNYMYNPTEYLTESEDVTEMTMCDVDLKLFLEQYDVYDIRYYNGYKFRKQADLFTQYIDSWYKVKEVSQGAERTIAKLMLNNLYGKFATNPKVTDKEPVLENGVIKYKIHETIVKDSIYVPIGIWCTAYARDKTIRTAQLVYDDFVYADTDSLHCLGNEIADVLKPLVHETKLGYWKNESNFDRARFLKAKTYIEDNKETGLLVKCAGMPDAIKEKVTWDNFKVGFKSLGKLIPVNVEGGVILEDREFTIKPPNH